MLTSGFKSLQSKRDEHYLLPVAGETLYKRTHTVEVGKRQEEEMREASSDSGSVLPDDSHFFFYWITPIQHAL